MNDTPSDQNPAKPDPAVQALLTSKVEIAQIAIRDTFQKTNASGKVIDYRIETFDGGSKAVLCSDMSQPKKDPVQFEVNTELLALIRANIVRQHHQRSLEKKVGKHPLTAEPEVKEPEVEGTVDESGYTINDVRERDLIYAALFAHFQAKITGDFAALPCKVDEDAFSSLIENRSTQLSPVELELYHDLSAPGMNWNLNGSRLLVVMEALKHFTHSPDIMERFKKFRRVYAEKF